MENVVKAVVNMADDKDGGALSEILKQFKFEIKLKEEQATIVNAIYRGKDVFGVLPTGFGKSMTYILTPLLMDKLAPGKQHTAVVISPLKALMADQVSFLSGHGIPAAAITEDAKVKDITDMGHISVLFSSPEAAVLKKWRELLKTQFSEKVCVLVFDEAHCISSWGQDFRPTYRQVPMIQSYLDAPNLVLTATATKKIQEDIYELLGLNSAETEVVSVLPDRQNIFMEVRPSTENFEEELSWLLKLLEAGVQRKKFLIYVHSINNCYQIYMWLTTSLLQKCFNGEPSPDTRRLEMFHSNTDNDSKTRIMEQFIKVKGNLEVLVSTVAFGMGVNVPNIDCVIHWGAPSSALRYWQEVGRCARDGRPGYAICFAFKRSVSRCEEQSLKDLLSSNDCIRHGILEQFLLDGMDTKDLAKLKDLELCNGGCKTCECMRCSCCIRCHKTCQCLKKQTNPLESFLTK